MPDETTLLADECAAEARSWLATVAEIASGAAPESAIPLLLLTTSQIQLVGARLGAIADVVLDGTKVTVTCGASRFTLLTMPVEDYPQLPAMPEVTGSADVTARVTVTNTGSRRAAHVVQLYVATEEGPVRRPVRELREPALPAHELVPGLLARTRNLRGRRIPTVLGH